MPSILAPSTAWSNAAKDASGEIWYLLLESSHGVRLVADQAVPAALRPSDPDLYDGTRTYNGAVRYGWGNWKLIEVLEYVLLRRPTISLELAPEDGELVAAGAQWRVQPWSVTLSPSGDWWRDALRRQEKMIGQPGHLYHTYSTLAASDSVRATTGILARFQWTREQIRLDYEPY